MRPTLALIVLIPLAAQAEQSREALITTLAGHQCRIAPHQVADVFGPAGFTPDFVRGALTEMILDGTASEDAEGTLSLPASLCPPEDPVPSPRDEVLQLFAADDCRLGAKAAETLEADLGLSGAQLRAILGPLYESGALQVGLGEARLSEDLCPARNG